MTKHIELTQGLYALVDDEDFEELSKHKWYAKKGGNTHYAVRGAWPFTSKIKMHRVILCAPTGISVDHINGNGLDNRRCNLRLATPAENKRNRVKQVNNRSGYKGVYWASDKRKWRAQIAFNGRDYRLGYFGTPEDAARAYDEKAKELHGKFASVNFP